MLWDVSVVIEEIKRARYMEEVALGRLQYLEGHIDDLMEQKHHASSQLWDPVIPQIPPQADSYLDLLPYHSDIFLIWLAAGVIFGLLTYIILCLPIIVLARKTWGLHKLRNRLSEQLRQNTKENLEMAKTHEEQAQKILALEAEHSKVKSEKKNLETQIRSLKRNAEGPN